MTDRSDQNKYQRGKDQLCPTWQKQIVWLAWLVWEKRIQSFSMAYMEQAIHLFNRVQRKQSGIFQFSTNIMQRHKGFWIFIRTISQQCMVSNGKNIIIHPN